MMRTASITRAVLVSILHLPTATVVAAESQTGTLCVVNSNDAQRECTELLYPQVDVKFLSGLPIDLTAAWTLSAGWEFRPAANLDVAGLWLRLTNPPNLELRNQDGDLYTYAPGAGWMLTAVFSGGIALTTVGQFVTGQDGRLVLTGSDTTGLYFNVSAGVFWDWRFFVRKQLKGVSLGLLGRGGLIAAPGATDVRFVLGPAIRFYGAE